ncbi:hypothetical protein PE143B_0128640 [Pseudomonas extremaustralis 14-3 substr. 14-3b]|nr:hypothetical protein PE143B_0128640 [Pseudomonas extremaustralis 14-3 substr. 14-3b]
MSGNQQPCLLGAIEQHLQSATPLTIASLGGMAALMAQAQSLVESPYLDVLAEFANSALPDESADIDKLLLQGFAECQDPCAIRSAADIVICSPPSASVSAPDLLAYWNNASNLRPQKNRS